MQCFGVCTGSRPFVTASSILIPLIGVTISSFEGHSIFKVKNPLACAARDACVVCSHCELLRVTVRLRSRHLRLGPLEFLCARGKHACMNEEWDKGKIRRERTSTRTELLKQLKGGE